MINILLKDLKEISNKLNENEVEVLYKFIQGAKERINIVNKLPEPIYIDEVKVDSLHVFVDGSFDKNRKLCGSGMVFLKSLEDAECFDEYLFSSEDTHNQWNIQGECEAAVGAVERALKMKCKEITIYHDYIGISEWALGRWKAKNPYTQGYAKRMKDLNERINIRFAKVKGHSKAKDVFRKWNDRADELARESLSGQLC